MMFQGLYTYFDRSHNTQFRRIGTLLIRTVANIYYSVWYKMSKTPTLGYKPIDCLTISLTSFPARINKIWLVLESLLRQSQMADRIVLYLSVIDFPKKEAQLPQSLLRLKKYGLEIIFVEKNLLSHKKWFYSFQDERNEYVITADDDIIYPSDMVEKLWNSHLVYPNYVNVRYGKQVAFNPDGIAPYSTWGKVNINPSYRISFGSGGGCIFPIRIINKGVFDENVFMRLCPNADDLWLYVFTCLSGIKTYLINGTSSSILNVQIRSDRRLYKTNCGEGQNDVQLTNILSFIGNKYGYYYQNIENSK